jgi:HD-GYP domain-containing protein (c-di-GMP phosphodiesterase class II)
VNDKTSYTISENRQKALSGEQMDKLDIHQMSLEDLNKYIDDLFLDIEETKQIPTLKIKSIMVPLIHNASHPSYLYQLFQPFPVEEYKYRHCLGVAIVSTLIGKWIGLSSSDLNKLTISALLYDVGNIQIPEVILNKPGKLTRGEYEILKKHTIYGHQLLNQSDVDCEEAAIVALQHHERENGQGYPNGLISEQIHPFSKIVAIADVFIAMLSNRVYQGANPLYEVLQQMNAEVYGKLSPRIFLPFMRMVMDLLIGHQIQLNDGRLAVILMINKYHILRPLVKIEDEIIDLNLYPSLEIVKLIN